MRGQASKSLGMGGLRFSQWRDVFRQFTKAYFNKPRFGALLLLWLALFAQ